MSSTALTCFKAYDIRGRIPDELNEDLAWRIGRAYAELLQPRTVAVGHDVRLSSAALSAALAEGLLEGGTPPSVSVSLTQARKSISTNRSESLADDVPFSR